jgi:hypothetical protein
MWNYARRFAAAPVGPALARRQNPHDPRARFRPEIWLESRISIASAARAIARLDDCIVTRRNSS